MISGLRTVSVPAWQRAWPRSGVRDTRLLQLLVGIWVHSGADVLRSSAALMLAAAFD